MANEGSNTLTVDPAAGRAASGSTRTIEYQPALDGVRALAVLAVLLFHADVVGFSGGYLGVSVFFTLSGYLITSLLAAEMDRIDRIRLGEFYARRARRLLPASILVAMSVAVAAAITDWFDDIDELRNQIIGSLLQVANWVFLASDGSYQDLLEESAGAASPLEHYWSLAIEEQFYWIWPLAFVGLWRLGRTHRHRVVVLGAVTAVAIVAAPVIASVWGADAAYWATPARAAEILLGALVGLVLFGRSVPPSAAVLAPIALGLLAAAVVLFPAAGGPAYAGALPAIGAVSAALLVGLQPESATRRWCSVGPLVWLGKISYGVYLFHWPIFVVMNEERIGVDGPLLLVMRLATTLVIAQLSFTLFEQPIRHGLRIAPRTTLLAGLGATAAAVGAAFVLVAGPVGSYWSASSDASDAAAIVVDDAPLELSPPSTGPDEPMPPGDAATEDATADDDSTTHESSSGDPADPPERDEGGRLGDATVGGEAGASDPQDAPVGGDPPVIEDTGESSDDDASTPGDTDTSTDTATDTDSGTDAGDASVEPVPEPSRPVRVVVVGDSTAEAIGAGLVSWAAERPTFAQVEVRSAPGCGFVRGGEFLFDGDWVEYQDGCANYFYRLIPEQAVELSPDVVVMVTTSWDVADRRWPDDTGSDTNIVASAERIRGDFLEVTAAYLDVGVSQVVWLEMPRPDPRWDAEVDPSEDPERHAVLHDAMAAAAEEHPGRVAVLDFDDWFDDQGFAPDREIRPDGVHLTLDASTAIAEEYLGDRVLRVALGLV